MAGGEVESLSRHQALYLAACCFLSTAYCIIWRRFCKIASDALTGNKHGNKISDKAFE
jgi:hypothetical protein